MRVKYRVVQRSIHFTDCKCLCNPPSLRAVPKSSRFTKQPNKKQPNKNKNIKSTFSLQDLVWWEDKSRPGSLGLSIEMTAYALLSLVKLGGDANMMEALRAVRWMSKKRNAEGGFTSTQDTVLGLESLTKYALAMVNASATDLSVLLIANDDEKLVNVNDDNRMLLVRFDLPSLPTTLEVFAQGEGCLLVQVSCYALPRVALPRSAVALKTR